MVEGTIIIIPILSLEEALKRKKGDKYSCIVVADSAKTYEYCDMNPTKCGNLADKKDIATATTFVTDCMLGLGDALANHDMEPILHADKEGRFPLFGGRKNAQKAEAHAKHVKHFAEKVNSTKTLRSLIQKNGKKVVTPVLLEQVEGAEAPRVLKIDFNDRSGVRVPHPLLLGLKGGNCLHKLAATQEPILYQSEDYDEKACRAYAEEKGSMMLLPGCGDVGEPLGGTILIYGGDWSDEVSSVSSVGSDVSEPFNCWDEMEDEYSVESACSEEFDEDAFADDRTTLRETTTTGGHLISPESTKNTQN